MRTDIGREGTTVTTTCIICHCNRSGRHAAVAAGKQRRGRAKCPAHSIPADDASFPCIISIRFQSFLNFVLGAENLDLENQNIFFKDYPGEECPWAGKSEEMRSELIRITGFVPINFCTVLLKIQPSRQNMLGQRGFVQVAQECKS